MWIIIGIAAALLILRRIVHISDSKGNLESSRDRCDKLQAEFRSTATFAGLWETGSSEILYPETTEKRFEHLINLSSNGLYHLSVAELENARMRLRTIQNELQRECNLQIWECQKLKRKSFGIVHAEPYIGINAKPNSEGKWELL